jgi:mRNA-degrading endonuclease RelE of RelBE toxin-antitoxin system
MVTVGYDPSFEKKVQKIKDRLLKLKVKKKILKIVDSPEIGKPMRYSKKGTREVYIPPFRLSYLYLKNEEKIIFLDLYHKDKQ